MHISVRTSVLALRNASPQQLAGLSLPWLNTSHKPVSRGRQILDHCLRIFVDYLIRASQVAFRDTLPNVRDNYLSVLSESGIYALPRVCYARVVIIEQLLIPALGRLLVFGGRRLRSHCRRRFRVRFFYCFAKKMRTYESDGYDANHYLQRLICELGTLTFLP